jgi:hypothetical protein
MVVQDGFGSEPYCTVFPSDISHPMDALKKSSLSAKARRPTYLLEGRGLARTGGSRALPLMLISRNPQSVAFHGRHSSGPPRLSRRGPMKHFLGVFVLAVWLLLPLSSAAQNPRFDDDRRPNQGYGAAHDRWQGLLSTEDQSRFDSYYSRWLDYRQTNDRENGNNMEDHMRDVMSHYNIPSDVPFDHIASNSYQGYGVHRRRR